MIRYIFSNRSINIFENYKSLSYHKGAILKCNNAIYLLILWRKNLFNNSLSIITFIVFYKNKNVIEVS